MRYAVADDDQRRRLVEVLALVLRRANDALVLGRGRDSAQAVEVGVDASAPQLSQSGHQLPVGDDDELHGLAIGAVRRPSRGLDESLQHLIGEGVGLEAPHRAHRRHDLEDGGVLTHRDGR